MDKIHSLLGHKPQPTGFWNHPIVTDITSNPLNLTLFVIFLYLFLSATIPVPTSLLTPTVQEARKKKTGGGEYIYLPAKHPQSTEWKKYTPKSLAVFDGTGKPDEESRTILLCIDRKVFDVTTGGRFYGPGGPYGNFAGRDASRGMAKQSFDEEMLTPLDQPIDTLSDLTQAERKAMDDWVSHFAAKYTIVGELVEDKDL